MNTHFNFYVMNKHFILKCISFSSIVGIMLVLSCCKGSESSQYYDEQLYVDIRHTGMVHYPLPLDYSKAYETFGLTKKVLVNETLSDMEDLSPWTHIGIGSMSQTSERSISGNNSLRLIAPTRIHPTTWIQGMPREGDTFWGLGLGASRAILELDGVNWEKYNRVMYYIYPDCEGARSICMNFYIENDGVIKVPDEFGREGYHQVNLKNREWNQCFLEITELPRDKVTRIIFEIETFGKELTMGDFLQFDIDEVQLQVVENPEVVSGWIPAKDRIIYSTTGYGVDSEKSAIVNVAKHDGSFRLIDSKNNRTVYRGKVNSDATHIGTFETIEFSDFKKEGQFMIRVGDITTPPFHIHRNIWDNSVWRVLNFMFTQRCGYPVPGLKGACHTDLNGEFNGLMFVHNGGWHDAADMSQNPMQTGEIAFSMFEMANRAKEKGNIDLHLRLLEEALWGMDYILRARLGGGFRIGGWSTNIWTDRLIGTIDDSGRRRLGVNNNPYQNFKFSGIQAYAAMSIDNDIMLKENLEKIAKEDFAYALERFNETDLINRPSSMPPAQYMATVSWAASMIYKLTGDPFYAEKAAHYIKYVLDCQRNEPLNDKDKLNGFFYRDNNKVVTLNYSHQGYDQIFMEAIVALCETQPNHADFQKWDNSIRLYAGFLKTIMQYVAPYGIIPSGVYNLNEASDSLAFNAQHGRFAGRINDFTEMVQNGFKLDNDGHYLRVFPIWFSFKGNIPVHLAQGKAAALCSKYLNDKELMDIAEKQLFWVVGKNPFGQSLIWGEGHNYMQQYNALPGDAVGQIPLGIQTRFNEDKPYWPQNNTAVYKEVFGVPAGKWFSLIAEF
jgi:hypothetical protein